MSRPPGRGGGTGRALRRWLPLLLLAAAAAIVVGSTSRGDGADPVDAVSRDLRCPACQGESVADSRSPVAAAMREVVAAQVAQGRGPEEIRAYFVRRYGEEVLATPPARGPGLLLWAVPAAALILAGAAAAGTVRGRAARPTAVSSRRTGSAATTAAGEPITTTAAGARESTGTVAASGSGATVPATPAVPAPRAGARVWTLGAAGLVAMVAAVAVAAPRLTEDPAPATAQADPVAVTVSLARDLEDQKQFAAAADLYREALRDRPDDNVRLRLAFTLIRSARPAEAEQIASQVLAGTPDAPEALLVLGLAQRETKPRAATATLRRFLAVAPDHPAAAEVRRLVDGR